MPSVTVKVLAENEVILESIQEERQVQEEAMTMMKQLSLA